MIPEQLRKYPLIKVCQPTCRVDSHGDCDHPGKRPVRSANRDRPVVEIRRWIEQGGNYGVVPRSDNDLLILDSDSDSFSRLVRQHLPDTFTVKTGSGNYHFYYTSSYSGNQSFKSGDDEFGSLRSDNWHCVGPGSVHPDTGQEYTVYNDDPVMPVPEAQLSDFVETVYSENLGREDGGGGGGGGSPPRLHGVKASDLKTEPTAETLRVLEFVNSASRRKEVAKVIDADHPPRNTRVWACGFLYSVCGLRQNQIEKLLTETASWASDRDRVETEIRSLVQSSTNNSRAAESVNLSKYLSGDMEVETSESQKTEESGSSRTLQGGENTMPEFTERESVQVKEGSSDGDRAIEAVRVEGKDGTDSFEFVSIRKGRVKTVELTSGEEGQMIDVDETNGKSVGGTADLQLVIEALQELHEEIN